MSFGSMKQRIIQEIHRAASGDEDAVKIAIITAMEWFKAYQFDFNEGTHTFTMTIGQEEYDVEEGFSEGYASDLVAPINLYVQTGGTRWLRMKQISINEQRWLQPTSTVTGVPSAWAWHDEKIYVTPTPSQADDLRMDYVKDIGIPIYVWTGSSWAFYEPTGSTALLDSWTSRWLTDGEELIRQRAKFDLYFNFYDDNDNAQKMDMATQAALANLRKRNIKGRALVGREATRI